MGKQRSKKTPESEEPAVLQIDDLQVTVICPKCRELFSVQRSSATRPPHPPPPQLPRQKPPE